MSNWVRRLEEKIKPWQIILLFLILMCFGFYKQANADVSVELGGAFLSGEYSKGQALVFTERFGDYSLGMGIIGPQEVIDRSGDRYTPDTNLYAFGQRDVEVFRNFDLGLGVAYFNNTNRALGSKFTASLQIKYQFTEHWYLTIRHYSNAGSASPNMGQDMLNVGYTF